MRETGSWGKWATPHFGPKQMLKPDKQLEFLRLSMVERI